MFSIILCTMSNKILPYHTIPHTPPTPQNLFILMTERAPIIFCRILAPPMPPFSKRHNTNNLNNRDRGVPRNWEGGAKNFFFQIWEFACREATYAAHGEAMSIARGVRGHAPPRKIFKTVQFGAF